MRVLFDTNVYISYLITGFQQDSTVSRLFAAVKGGEIDLVLPDDVVADVLEKIATKPAIAARTDVALALEVIRLMRALAVSTPAGPVEVVPLARDPDDDVLLAYAVAEGVDYLVTGDKDLLVLGDALAPLKIRSPQAFLDELAADS